MAARKDPLRLFSDSSSPYWKYDVFLSFIHKNFDTIYLPVDSYAEYVHNYFTIYLFAALSQKGISAVMDPGIAGTSSFVLKAIEESRISIVVLSSKYRFSSWCLDQLAKIMDCKNKKMGHIVIPIFYDIRPGDKGETAIFNDEETEKVNKWREALEEAANLSGFDLHNMAYGYVSYFSFVPSGESGFFFFFYL